MALVLWFVKSEPESGSTPQGKHIPLRSFGSWSQHEGKLWKHLGEYKYDEFKEKLCGDLKVVVMLLGMQLAYTKYCSFLCEWDSRDKKNHYVNKLWSKQTSLTPGEKNVVNPLLILPEKIYLPPLHIKLSLMKNFVKIMVKPAVDSNRRGISFQMWVAQKSRRVYL